jgi:hypothetical protein
MELPGPYELRIGKKKVYLPEGSKAFIQSTTRKSERGKSLWEYLDYCILTRWLHGCLWLMADDAARPALEAFMGLSIKEADYIKHRQRLKLIDWKAAHKKPPIIGYSLPKQRFVFEEGWTHLDSKLSR